MVGPRKHILCTCSWASWFEDLIHRICRARFDYYLVNRQAPRTGVLSISYSWSSRDPSSLGEVHPLRALSYVKGPWHESCGLQLIRIGVVSSFLLFLFQIHQGEHLEKPPFGCDLQEGASLSRALQMFNKWEPQRNKISGVSELLQYGFQLHKTVFLWSNHKSDCTFFVLNLFGVHGNFSQPAISSLNPHPGSSDWGSLQPRFSLSTIFFLRSLVFCCWKSEILNFWMVAQEKQKSNGWWRGGWRKYCWDMPMIFVTPVT